MASRGKSGESKREARHDRMTGGVPRSPVTHAVLAWLGCDDDHRIQTLLRSARMPKVSMIMSPIMSAVMSAVAGQGILPLRVCAPIATGALCFGGRHKDGEGEGKEDPQKEDSHTSDVAHNIPSCIR
jgi:hypothetical protein